MHIDYVPLFQIQRDLLARPRNLARFQEYLGTVLDEQRQCVVYPPLVAMNPMGQDHIAACVDGYLDLDADDVAEETIADVLPLLAHLPGSLKLGFVVVDDVHGGWTNRYAVDYELRFGADPDQKRPRWLHDDWLSCVLWASEEPSELAVREAIRTALYRHAYLREHGQATTLGTRMAQEGHVLALAGCTTPTLDSDDLEYTREVLEPFLDETDTRTCMECLYGDEPGQTLGFTPRGLSPWAGLALALYDAQGTEPECDEPTLAD